MTQWVVICDASQATIFAREIPRGRLEKLCEIQNPKVRLHNVDLVSDEPGRLFKKGRHAENSVSVADPRTSPHEVEVERHAHRIAGMLQVGLNQQKYQSVGIVAPPHFLGEIRNLLGPQVEKHLSFSIAKELAGADALEVSRRLVEMNL